MNWTGIITFLAIITGIYFIWRFLSQKEANPTTQEAFGLITDVSGRQYAPPGGVVSRPAVSDPSAISIMPMETKPIANELPVETPQGSVTYDTVYNIVVEAPVIPEMDAQDIIDDLTTDIAEADNDPITQPTSGSNTRPKLTGDPSLYKSTTPTGTTYSTAKAIVEKTIAKSTDPINMLADPTRSDPMDTSVKSMWIGGR